MSRPLEPFDAYVQALETVQGVPAAETATLKQIEDEFERSVAFADASTEEADRHYEEGKAAVERHLRNATRFLARIDETTRIPPRIKPSIIPDSATTTAVDAALASLSAATIALGVAVDTLLAQPKPTEVAGPEPAQQAGKETNKTPLVIATAVLGAIALFLILVFVL